MIRHIVFITPVTFNDSQRRWFGLEYLKKNNLKVEVWDVTSFIQNKASAAAFAKNGNLDHDMLTKLYSYKELAIRLEGLSQESLAVCFFGYQPMYYRILRLLTRYKVRYAYIMNYPFPTASLASRMQKGGLKYLCSWAKRLPEILKHHLFLKCPPSLMKIAAPKYILAGGEKSLLHPHVLDKGTEIIWLHCFDCEDLYSTDNKQSLDQNLGKYAVFIDQCLPFHPDTLTGSNRAAITAENYYPLLNQFFSLIEQTSGCKIVIAAHPRANHMNDQYFGGRTMVRGSTSRLVKNAEFVLMHCSAAMSYVVMFQKPCLFLTTRHFKGSHTWHETETMARSLGTEPVVIEDVSAHNLPIWQEALKIDRQKYKKYQEDFLKSNKSEDLPFWEGFVNYLQKRSAQLGTVL